MLGPSALSPAHDLGSPLVWAEACADGENHDGSEHHTNDEQRERSKAAVLSLGFRSLHHSYRGLGPASAA